MRRPSVRPLCVFVVLALAAFASSASAETAYLLKQISTAARANPSFPNSVTNSGGITYLDASDSVHGDELFRSDGTAAGTTLVKDICPGTCSSLPTLPADRAGTLMFIASDGTGFDIWRSNGTAAGTTQVTNFHASGGSIGGNFVSVGATMYFTATDSTNGAEVWSTDGTPGGTSLVANIAAGSASSDPFGLQNANGTVMFFADDGSGNQVWKIVGGTASKVSSTVFTVSEVRAVGSLYYFVGDDSVNGPQLWVSDGTTTTMLTTDLQPGLNGIDMTGVGSQLFFIGHDATNGHELWTSNGTMGGTHLVQDLRAGSSDSAVQELIDNGGTLFFVATPDGTNFNIYSATTSAITQVSMSGAVAAPNNLQVAAGGRIVFLDDHGGGSELYGLAGNTVTQLTSIGGAGGFLIGIGTSPGLAWYDLNDNVHGDEAWVSDGTPAGTHVININPDLPYAFPDFGAPQFTDIGGGLFVFGAMDDTHGQEPWITDGTTAGTNMLADINPSGSSTPKEFENAGAQTFFMADDGTGRTIWRTDGTTLGTTKAVNLPAGANTTVFPLRIGIFNTKAYFGLDDVTHGVELWSSDGTPGGSGMVLDIEPGAAGSDPDGFAALGSALLFDARTNVHGRELWTTDGTGAGTAEVKDINPGASGSITHSNERVVVGNTLYFAADDGTAGEELWKSDGTGIGTTMVADIRMGAASSTPSQLTALGNLIFFRADNGLSGTELWIYDTMTTSITQADICPGACGGFPDGFVAFNGLMYFSADDGVHGRELWSSDGTVPGTHIVDDLVPGTLSSFPNFMAGHNGSLFFDAVTPATGEELFKTDGTPAGTTLAADLVPGSGGSSPTFMKSIGNVVVFWATTPANGTQVFAAGCSPATHLQITAPANAIAGTPFMITVTPLDAMNNVDLCYSGTVHFTTSDLQGVLPADYTFVGGENGHVFSVTLRTAGTQSITATDTFDNTINGSANVVVAAGPASGANSTLVVMPTSVRADGTTVLATVTARDAFGNSITTGGDTVVINSTIGTVSAVTDHGDGTYTATISSMTPGGATVSATINAQATNTVGVQFLPPPNAAQTTIVANPTAININGGMSTITVTVRDASGNPIGVGGDTVVLNTTLGTLGPVTDNGNGTYTATLSSNGVGGNATVTGTLNGSPIGGSAVVAIGLPNMPVLSPLTLLLLIAAMALAALIALR